jgi:hypothetical protein
MQDFVAQLLTPRMSQSPPCRKEISLGGSVGRLFVMTISVSDPPYRGLSGELQGLW